MRNKIYLFIIILLVFMQLKAIDAPQAERNPYTFELHGTQLSDDYQWLKDKARTDPKVMAYLEEENKYTEMMTYSSLGLQDTLYKEFRNRIPDEDITVPYRLGNYWYYSREDKDAQYRKYCRKYLSLANPENIYLDVDKLAAGREYLNVNNLKISPDETMLAYLADYDGSENYTFYVKDLVSGNLLPDSLYMVDDICWANDNKTIFFCTIDEAGRTDKVWRHTLGNAFSEDDLVYEEPDESFYAYVDRTKSGKFIIIGTSSKTSSEMRFFPADDPRAEPRLVEPRRPDIQYYLTHHENEFLVSTNENAPDYKLMRVSDADPSRENWQEFIPARQNISFNFDVFKTHLVLYETENYQDRIRIISFEDNEDYSINPPNPTAKLYSSTMPQYDSASFRYLVESMEAPWQQFEYNFSDKMQKIIKEQQVNDYQPGRYVSQRLYATAPDGEQIPISIVYNVENFALDGTHPMLLTGYGAYGDNSNPYFSVTKLSLLDRGYSWAIAHVRGGGEMGRRWYDEGRMQHKKNTFTDFIAVSEFLINNDYTRPQLLVIEGASAGGLLIGAVNNMRPDLFGVVVGDVPFVDMMNTMLDPTLSATVSEYEEWGNPQIKEEFEYMYSYCPYYNVKSQDYPNTLLLGGFWDPRVNYWEPAKLCAKMRVLKTDDNLLLLKISDAGHGGSSGRFDYLNDIAFEFAFIIDRIRLAPQKQDQ
ncbi:MAG: S9 family peptidase [Candidatus Cloacimonetes bacterium]|nr:S9 family peptidase [Candidatus Cloacimonadota bacterium]